MPPLALPQPAGGARVVSPWEVREQGGIVMAKYLLKVRYTAEGLKGVLSDEGSARREAAQKLAESVGGSIESFYFAFGEDDAYVICEVPDHKAATAAALTVSASGRVEVSTTPLLSVEEIDEVANQKGVEYSPPGS